MLRKIMCLLAVAVLLGIGSAQGAIAITVLDEDSVTAGLQFSYDLNGGAFITDTTAPSNTFNANDLINMNDGVVTNDGSTGVSDPFPLSVIPVVEFGGIKYFQFIYDMQETGQAIFVSIDDIVLTAGVVFPPAPAKNGYVVWDYDQATYGSIVLNTEVSWTPETGRAVKV